MTPRRAIQALPANARTSQDSPNGCNLIVSLQYDQGSGQINTLAAVPIQLDGITPSLRVDLSPLASKAVTI